MSVSKDLELLRCERCTGYLSCAPIWALGDGSTICNNCTSFDKDGDVSRQYGLEKLITISQQMFPCAFGSSGCKIQLLFGESRSHEAECVYRLVMCPFTKDGCKWKEPLLKLHQHCSEGHPSNMQCEKFELQLVEDQSSILVLSQDNVAFFIPYQYNVFTKTFRYSIKFYKMPIYKAHCTITLANESNCSNYVKLGRFSCTAFDNDLLNPKPGRRVDLNNYIQILRSPNCIAFEFNVTFSNKDDLVMFVIDYTLLEKIRCANCYDFLTPPIFQSKNKILCSSCSDAACTPYKNAEIEAIMKKANYPCRWRNCRFIGNCDNTRDHCVNCEFRQYFCFASKLGNTSCNKSFKRIVLVEHLGTHNFKHFNEKYSVEFNSLTEHNCEYEYTMQDNEFVGMVVYNRQKRNCTLDYCVKAWSSNVSKFTICVTFEHTHCALKSKEFYILPDLQERSFTYKDFPTCFKEAPDITAVIKVVRSEDCK